MKEKIEPPNEKEHAWIAAQLARAADFAKTYGVAAGALGISLDVLDEAFAAWMAEGAPGKQSRASEVINCVGIAFGQSVVDGLGFQWVVATDEHGAELAVYGLPGTGDVLVYPANFVAKRWERGEIDFLAESYRRIESDVKALARQFRQ